MRLFFADLAELLARVTVGLLLLQLLAVVLRVVGRMKRKRWRRAPVAESLPSENYALWALTAVVVAVSSAVASWLVH